MNDVGYYLLASFGSICVLLGKKKLETKRVTNHNHYCEFDTLMGASHGKRETTRSGL
jgi:hypothetical protein